MELVLLILALGLGGWVYWSYFNRKAQKYEESSAPYKLETPAQVEVAPTPAPEPVVEAAPVEEPKPVKKPRTKKATEKKSVAGKTRKTKSQKV